MVPFPLRALAYVSLQGTLFATHPILAKEADYETRSTPLLPFRWCSFLLPRWPLAELLALLNYESKPNQPVRRQKESRLWTSIPSPPTSAKF